MLKDADSGTVFLDLSDTKSPCGVRAPSPLCVKCRSSSGRFLQSRTVIGGWSNPNNVLNHKTTLPCLQQGYWPFVPHVHLRECQSLVLKGPCVKTKILASFVQHNYAWLTAGFLDLRVLQVTPLGCCAEENSLGLRAGIMRKRESCLYCRTA